MKNTDNNSRIVYINTYKNIKSPQVLDKIDIYTYLHEISNPDKIIQEKIEEARSFYKEGDEDQYDAIKLKLPCYTLNFGFDKYKNNSNIIGSTGLIYIDVDDETSIDLTNQLIFASWKSVSNNGRGVLVKIDGLDLNNFKYNYNIISEELGVKSDKRASKPTQFTIQSYDSNLYINEDAISYKALEVKEKVPTSILIKEEKKGSTEVGIKPLIRYDTINDYDFKDESYIYFPEEKEFIAELYVSKTIEDGARNSKLYAIGIQFRALNPHLPSKYIEKYLQTINIHHCKPPLKKGEILSIVRSIMSVEEPKPSYNKERRILFNPELKLSRIEKVKIINPLLGLKRSEETYQELKEHVKNWDYQELGKVTEKKLIKLSGRSKNTVRKYYSKIRKDLELH